MPLAPPVRKAEIAARVSRRAHCSRCALPLAACVCPWRCLVNNIIPVLVLQHPGEVAHAKSTVRLLRLSMSRCQVRVGEVFQPDELGLAALSDVALLYPEPPGRSNSVAGPAMLRRPSCLLVLDGTWRKTHRMVCRNPWLAGLPRISLSNATASAYRIRQARRGHQLSTLEATCLALGEMEGDASRYAGLLQGMEGFVAAIARRMSQCKACTEPEPRTLDFTLPGLPE